MRELAARVTRMRPRLPAASWTKPESQHLTFAFLGEQPESLVEPLAQRLAPALAAIPRFEARLRSCGFFPHARRARVGWIGIEPESGFASIATVVREIVTASGIPLDRAEFRPHLTLVRMKDPWPPASIELFSQTLRDYASDAFEMREVTLFSSQLHPSGAVHTALKTFALAPA